MKNPSLTLNGSYAYRTLEVHHQTYAYKFSKTIAIMCDHSATGNKTAHNHYL